MDLLIIALAPVAALLFFIYIRDKYEKEPPQMLFRALGLGALVVFPVMTVERTLSAYLVFFDGLLNTFWHAFVVAAFTEESFKLLALYLLVWRSVHFSQKFDGIVYAVFVSMGFAAIENIMYVFDYGYQTGLVRAFTAVPGHFLFAIPMGFYFGLAKFYPADRQRLMKAALIYPILLHGVYDFILMSQHFLYFLVFIPFVVFMWRYGMDKIRKLAEDNQ
jgi:RsiW-degrading membrane proteinase PrsW (M82 family)